jgi:3-methylcrotonyl-CoA carboxylase beta subunit
LSQENFLQAALEEFMEVLPTFVVTGSSQFQVNAAHHRELAGQLQERMAQTAEGGGEKYRKRHEAQHKLFVRDRIDRLLDP